MGFRFHKSINLGKGFRINISKSGIGYSWGVKGFRVTKTAKGTTRKTFSIPGTGLSYVSETKSRKFNSEINNDSSNDGSDLSSVNVIKGDVSNMVSDDLSDFLSAVKRRMLIRKLINIVFVSYILIFFSIIFYLSITGVAESPPRDSMFKLYLATFSILILVFWDLFRGGVKMDYVIDDEQKDIISQRLNLMLQVINCKKVWGVVECTEVIDKRYSAGASESVSRIDCEVSKKAPFPFKTNTTVACFKINKENLIFFPDKIFIINGNKIGVLNYSDVSITFGFVRFIEYDTVPSDTKIVDNTWMYVNKSGDPDRRFKDNRELPVCLYGELKLTSDSGLNTSIMFSNPNIVREQ